jgi:hypothetical protein
MKRSGLTWIVLALLAVAPMAALGQRAPDDLIITGAGFGNGWETEIELADSEMGVGTTGSLWIRTGLSGPCPPICEAFEYSVSPKGTVRILLSEAFPFYPHLMTVHVTTDTEQPLPIVRTRIFNASLPGMSAEIPVLRNPTLSPRSFPVLVFPGLRRQPGVYSNLILQSFGFGSGTPSPGILVEAFGPNGERLGSETLTPPPIETAPSVLVDVAARLGVSSVDGGSVRVSSPSGQVWGVLATVYANDHLAMIPGAIP